MKHSATPQQEELETIELETIELEYPLIAIGDIHGQLEWLDRLVERLACHPLWPSARIVFLGDLVDRGPDVQGAVQRVCELLDSNPGSVALAGNHDYALTRAAGIECPVSPHWVRRYAVNYDHQPTFESYLGRPARSWQPADPRWAADLEALREAIPPPHRKLLGGLAWVAEAERHVFIHNGLSPSLQQSAEEQLRHLRARSWPGAMAARPGTLTERRFNPEYPVWLGADKSLSLNPLPVPGKQIVSGHVKVLRPEVTAAGIRIDTSGGLSPPLTACLLADSSAPPEMIHSHG